MITDEQFDDYMKLYKDDFIWWYRYVNKYVEIDRESFLSEFQYILFKSLTNFDQNKAKVSDGFKRYFFKSLKKMASSLMRKTYTNKHKIEQQFISLSLKRHDLADKKQRHPLENVIKDDLIAVCGDVGAFAWLKADGYSEEEIREFSGMGAYEYRKAMRSLRKNSWLYTVLSRN